MKRLVVLVLFSPLLVVAQKPLTVSGKIQGLKDQSAVSLTDVYNLTDTVAKGTVKNGEFVLKGTLKTPKMVSLNMDNKLRAVFFLENSTVKVNGDVKDLKNVKVTGSPTQASFED